MSTNFWDSPRIYLLTDNHIGTIALLLILHVLKVRQLGRSLSARTHSVRSSIRKINIVIYIIMEGRGTHALTMAVAFLDTEKKCEKGEITAVIVYILHCL